MRTPSVEIQFGGKTRHLIFDFNAFAELEDIAGTYQSGVAHMKAVRAALWAGMLAETLDARGRETKQTLSLIDVGEILQQMIDEDRTAIEGITEAISRAIAGAKAPDEKKPPVGEKAPDGERPTTATDATNS